MRPLRSSPRGVERIFLTAYKAEPSMPEDLIVGSLIDFDGSLKPSYYAVKTMVMLLGDFEEAEMLGSKTYRFRAGNLTIYLLWGEAPKTLSGEALKVSMLGEAEMVRVEELRPEGEPYYIVVGSRKELEELQSRLGEIAPAGGVAVGLIWGKLPERGMKKPDVVLGQDSFESDLPPSYTRRGLFWPGAIWFDGHFLWIGEYKFSNRILRYS